ncbi:MULTISPECIES: SRPBCC family protein [Streptomyces]|uniref:SRPBCC family protein n=1 Tax=Streptomyces albidocamelliae TaxID=2981135 RepID=A0ABY6EJV6_9ACTN|nr:MULTISPECIES: SRPBCC family protein [unclassified Streptomyces]OKJ81824.1 polyketide cyclase [Streptomyces sp. CB01883]ROP54875.1 polyketide cyclase/dehydrase/lipid transport protein [Streptomyces sp. PanSC9]UXY34288.1 SRPBCC family protein [Streptomyces sp. HUAS 14-6]
MAQRLRPVGPEFVETAPVRLVFTRDMAAAPGAVFQALAEDLEGWPAWFSAVSSARPTEGGREVRLRGGTRFEETILAAKAPELYAYRVDVTNTPGARAWVEEWRLTPAGTGTRVRMTFALDGTAAFRLVCRLIRPGVGRAFRTAVTALDRRLR